MGADRRLRTRFRAAIRELTGQSRTPPRVQRPVAGRQGYAGAQGGRLFADWNAMLTSPDQEIRWFVTTLRARARQLVRDNSNAAGFVNELANNVIGPDGILLQAAVTAGDGSKVDRAICKKIEAAWAEWGMPENATADGYESWIDFQRTVIRTIAIDGEVFIRKLKYFDNPFAFSLQIIDADLVDESYSRPASAGQNEIRMGVEVNRFNRPVAYHVWSRHVGDMGPRERFRISADEIIHRFIRTRANQPRGVTWFAPVLVDLHYLDGYEFAELQAARISAAKMGFILNKGKEAVDSFEFDPANRKTMEVDPGVIDELLPGQEFAMFDPSHPSNAFKDFTKTILRGIARGLNMAYTTLTGDLEAVNYSSIRAGLLSERDHFRYLQGWLGIHVHRLVYRDWVAMALLSGALQLGSRIASKFFAVKWRGRGWKWVDPVNDLTAAALAIALGLDTRSRLAAEHGRDFEENVEEIARELEFADSMGINVSESGHVPIALPADGKNDDGQQDGSSPNDTSEPDDTSSDDSSDATPIQRKRAGDRSRQIRALKLALTILERAA